MGEEIKNLLEEEIKNEIENLASLEPGSEKHSTAVESLAKLYKVKLDEDKTSMEYLDKTQNRKSDEGFKVAQIEENVKDSRKEKTMSIDQLELILYDMYHMDAWMPPLFGKWTEEFKKSSYSQWAVDELKDFIAERIYPRTSGSIDEFCELAHEFMVKMFAYSKVNPRTSQIFKSAGNMAVDNRL